MIHNIKTNLFANRNIIKEYIKCLKYNMQLLFIDRTIKN